MITNEIEISADERVQELLTVIVQSLVDDTQSVEVVCSATDKIATFKLRVAPEDVGKLIGKQGRTARSLRTILSAAGRKFQRRYLLEIESDGEVKS